MKLNKILLLSLIMLGSTLLVHCQNQSIKFIENDLDAAKEMALESKKLIFVDAYATWCGPCKWMSANIFTNDLVADYYNENFVNLKLNMEKGDGKDFAKKYSIRAYPTLVFIDGEGNVHHRKVGALREPESFVALGETAQSEIKNLKAMHDKYQKGELSKEFITEYLKVLKSAGEKRSGVLAAFYAKIEPAQFQEKDVFEMIVEFDNSVNSKAIEYILENRALFNEKYEEETKELLYDNHLEWVMDKASGKKEDRKEMELRMIKVKKRNIPEWQKIVLIADLSELIKEKRMDEYVEIAVADVGEYFNDDPGALHGFARTVLKNTKEPANLEEALKWTERAIEQENHPTVLDTKADILFELDRKQEAIAAEQEAIELTKEKGMSKARLELYEKKLEKFKK